jgi:glyoxylate/hydroxypyruvate reductase A
MSLLITINGWDAAPWAAMFQRLAPGLPVHMALDARNRDAIRYAAVWKPKPGLLAQLPNLAVIFNLGAGVDAILADETIPADIPIVRGVEADLTARMVEWVALHVLFHHRQMPQYMAQQSKALWRPIFQPAASEVSVGIMGLGALGSACAESLKRLGFRVCGWSRTHKALEGVASYAGENGLDAFLGQTDILVCLLPLTAETTSILNRSLFRKLHRDGPLGGPIVINAGRGRQQIERDLIDSLNDGTLKGASLDVFEEEPLPPDSPLWHHPRVFITPHVAADSTPAAICEHIVQQIARLEAGQPIGPLVDRQRGY